MATRRWILSLLSAAMISVLAGCSSNTFNVQNPPPPPPNLAINLSTMPANPLPVNQTTTLAATVTGDPNNYGVDWSVTCSNPDCGKLSAPHTVSCPDPNCAVTYTPPVSFPGNSETVNIVAFATADNKANASASIKIVSFDTNNIQAGSYVLQLQGSDPGFQPYQFAGVIQLDGNGVIMSGEQTVNFVDASGAFVSNQAAITGGSYFLGPDGRGTITIIPDPNDTEVGPETIGFVLLSSSHALIALVPPSPTVATPAAASGTMDLQTAPPPTLHSGGYAFVVSGTDFAQGVPTAIGGIFNVDSTNNTIPGPGSVADQNLAGVMTVTKKLTGALSYPNPNPFGIVTLTLSVPLFPSTTNFQFTGYIVDDNRIKLIESDTNGLGWTAGLAIGQIAGFGSFSGTYVFGVPGVDLSINYPSTLTSVGVFTSHDNGDGTGSLQNGYTDTFLQQYFNPNTGTVGAQISASFDGTYTIDAVTGHVVATLKDFSPRPSPGYQPRFFFYPTGNGNPPLVLASGGTNYPLVGAGIAYPQTSTLTFSGDYGFSFTQQNGGQENDGTGQMTVDPTAPYPLLGIVDSAIASGQSFRGTFTSDPCSPVVDVPGCFPGTLQSADAAGNGTNAFLTASGSLAAHFYKIDQDHGFFVETDLVDLNNPSGVVSFGYYARRSLPVPPGSSPLRRHRR